MKKYQQSIPLFIKIDGKNIEALRKVSSGLLSRGQQRNDLEINHSVNSENTF